MWVAPIFPASVDTNTINLQTQNSPDLSPKFRSPTITRYDRSWRGKSTYVMLHVAPARSLSSLTRRHLFYLIIVWTVEINEIEGGEMRTVRRSDDFHFVSRSADRRGFREAAVFMTRRYSRCGFLDTLCVSGQPNNDSVQFWPK